MVLGQSIFSQPKKEPAPTPYAGSGIGQKKNILGQPIVAEPPKQQAAPTKLGLGGLITSSGQTTGALKLENAKLQAQADAPESPRSQAARIMKRQAGIGQLKTMHKPTSEELL